MAKDTGILLGANGDLLIQVNRTGSKITSGLTVGAVTRQNQRTILLCEKGELKSTPTQGVGIGSFLDDDDISHLLREVRLKLREDRQQVEACGFDRNGKLIIKAGYES